MTDLSTTNLSTTDLMDLLTQCKWPDLAEPYNQALQQATTYILQRFQICGIIASGSIIHGNPDPNSDLDIYVIHSQPKRQRIQRFFNTVRTEIFVNPPSMIRQYFEEERKGGRPSTAHMLATGVAILEIHPIVGTLQGEAKIILQQPPDLSAMRLEWLRYMAADGYENAVDVVQTDSENGSLLLHRAIGKMIEYYFLAANRPIPRDKELLSTLFALDPEIGDIMRKFYAAEEAAIRFEIGAQIAIKILGVTGFFEWETDLEVVGL